MLLRAIGLVDNPEGVFTNAFGDPLDRLTTLGTPRMASLFVFLSSSPCGRGSAPVAIDVLTKHAQRFTTWRCFPQEHVGPAHAFDRLRVGKSLI